ncbi:MAG TPA: hypothetical protein PLL64_13035 [Rhodothermales bacterium]|nr:hypothetical protein [Rhodothermales bacterium]HRR09110.1 hypothetical protein [Rhodothermales bacterium]
MFTPFRFLFALFMGFLVSSGLASAQTAPDSTQNTAGTPSELPTVLPDLSMLDKAVSLFYVRGFLAEDRIPNDKRAMWEAKLNALEARTAKMMVGQLKKEQQLFLRSKLLQDRISDLPADIATTENRAGLPKPKANALPKTAPPQVKGAAKVLKGAAHAAGGAMCNNLSNPEYWEWLGICD